MQDGYFFPGLQIERQPQDDAAATKGLFPNSKTLKSEISHKEDDDVPVGCCCVCGPDDDDDKLDGDRFIIGCSVIKLVRLK